MKEQDIAHILEQDQRVSVREKLFREMVANLLIHREYLNPAVSMITIEADKVSAVNANKPLHYDNFETYKFQSHPKNPTIALFFVQIGRAEFLGTGIRNIVKYNKIYSNSIPCFEDNNMFSVKIPITATEQVREQVREQVSKQIERLLFVITEEHSITEMMNLLHLSGRRYFLEKYIHPAMKDGWIEMSQPDSPNSPKQKYHLTDKGKQIKQTLSNNE